jgi:tRNA threonylcarbamoyladenosine biosynthesis protein TsaE
MSDPGSVTIETASASQTHLAGALLGALAQAGDVVALSGELGAGKTALAQGIAEGVGVVGHVPSPTFNILLVHRAPVTMYHLDLYRLDDPRQLVDIDFYDTVEGDGLCVIEWADRFPDELPADRLDVSLSVSGEGCRTIRASGTGARSRALARAWGERWDAEGGRNADGEAKRP